MVGERIPDELVRGAADIVLGFANDLTKADAMIELVAAALLAERLAATERAAKIAEDAYMNAMDEYSGNGLEIAAAIRSQP